MNLDQIINLLVTITLIEMMATVGLEVTVAELAGVAQDWRLVARAALANYVCVPAAAVGLLLVFDPHPMVAAGFLVLAVCPGAPFAPPLTAVARGNVAVSVGLMALLAASSALLAPLLLEWLLPVVAGGDEIPAVEAHKIVTTLLITQLVPLCAGVAVRHWRPDLAARALPTAKRASLILNLVVIVLIFVAQFPLLLEIRPRGLVGMAALLCASAASGWLLGGPAAATRRAVALTTALRNVGVGLVIASSAFAGTPALTAAVAYGLFEVAGSLLLALVWNGREANPVVVSNVKKA
jgi:BASS family bile acid:Na+ symporter